MTENDQTLRRCPACGREMVLAGPWWECSNGQCDYVEDAEDELEEDCRG